MYREFINNLIQNKNVVMFITSLFFMGGILSCFNNCSMTVAVIFTIILIVLNIKNYIPYKYILLWGIIFYIGFFNTYFRVKDSDDLVKLAPSNAEIVARIVTIPSGNPMEKQKFFVQLDEINGQKISAKTIVNLISDGKIPNDINIGNKYKISGKLRLPFKASNPSQFDYGKYLKNFNTFTIFYANNEDCIQIDEQLPLNWQFLQGLNNIRNQIISTHSLYLKSPNLEILGGIVFGDDAVSPPDYIKDTFKNSGLLHILAASGMNVAFIYGFWYFILRRLRVPMNIIVISGIFVIILYTLMTGLGASVVRAALMLIFVLAGKLIDRDSNSIALLAFVASLMLLYNPAYINDVGFQLSFIVTFGLLVTANAILNKIKDTKIPPWLCAELLVPVVAQLWVAPLQMFYFNTISTYSILANIAIMPFLSVISFGGFVSSVLAVITPISKYVCMVFDFVLKYCLDILVYISNFFSTLDYSVIETTHPAVLQVLLYYVILLLITFIRQFRFNKKYFWVTVGLIVVLFLSTLAIPNKNLEVIAFDVQNADAFLIKSPLGKYFLIDTGKAPYNGGKSQAEVIILKYLKDRGIKNIEGMVISHFDSDHSGGAVDILNGKTVKNVYINSYNNKSQTSSNIYKTLVDKNIKYSLPRNGEKIYEENDFSLTAYRPNGKTDNEQSIIILLSYGNFQTLFTGDAGVEGYQSVKKYLPSEKIEVLKVGHHGAKGVVDPSMIETLQSDVSIISTGQNIFGHPNLVTLDTLRNTDIYRTDHHNSIKITSNQKIYTVYTFDKLRHRYKKIKDYKI